MDGICMCGPLRKAEKEKVWGCYAADTVGDLYKGTLNKYGYQFMLYLILLASISIS